ncbi:MAG: sigma-70 family RNA polymerase sigma factor [Betaproteobacteria bacterium]|nr:sigma-70 family RNA polymerase sigma factor [Betaproteobacteria bacterium]
MSQNYGGLFQAWELAIAKKLVRELHETSRALQHDEADDLLQEVLLHWYHARASHDPMGKASIRTYMARVVRNKLIDLIRERESDKEKVNILAVPTEITHEGEPGSTTDDAGGDPPEPEEAREHRDAEQSLHLDLARALARLTPRQRELCQLLLEQDLSMVKASQRLRVPRSTLYEELKHIRTIFKALGLDAYLR